uniref:BTAD domain-containing putative transcriptional regulator n=1 Tax=Hamadaea tsunoensis TaxID=53368 RepID=UPI001B7FB50A
MDALRFADLAAQGRPALVRDDPRTARDLPREALGLWRGRPYDTVSGATRGVGCAEVVGADVVEILADGEPPA